MNLYLRLLEYIKPYWRIAVVAIIAMIITAAMEPLLPALMEPLIDGSLIEKDPDKLLTVPLLLLLVFVIRGAFTYVTGVASQWVAQKAILDIRIKLFKRLNQLPLSTYHSIGSGALISKLTFDVPQVAGSLSNAWIILVRDSFMVLGLLGYMLYASWELTIVMFITTPFFSIVIFKVSKMLRKSNILVQDNMGNMTNIIEESLNLSKEIKIYNTYAIEEEKFNTSAKKIFKQLMRITQINSANVPIIQSITAIAMVIVLYVASIMTVKDVLTPGQFIAFIGAMSLLFSPIRRLAAVNADLQKGMAAAKSIFDLLDEEIEQEIGTQTLTQIKGDIYFKNVTFSYDKEPVLSDFSLHIKKNQTTALVGFSGSGKTTITQLINNFYTIDSGEIILDSTNINHLTLVNLRKHIALVSQDVNLFDDSIYNNVAYGDIEHATQEQVINALKSVHAYDFVMKLPEGIHTHIGKNGSKLSGGQKQRISLARAFVKNAKILILDESTSALDSTSEKYIQSAISTLTQTTKIIIAHRLSTILNADTIIVMNKGKIVEQGNHAELIAKSGVYTELYNKQLKE